MERQEIPNIGITDEARTVSASPNHIDQARESYLQAVRDGGDTETPVATQITRMLLDRLGIEQKAGE